MDDNTCYLYARMSRDREGGGLGVDRQLNDCRELATRLGRRIIGTYADNDLSAYSGKPRPDYLRMLADLRNGGTKTVLAWHTDRLHRSPVELEEYIDLCDARNITTHTVKAGPLDLSTPSGRMVARMLGGVARYEVEHMIERQKRAKEQAAGSGRWLGGRRPYGWEGPVRDAHGNVLNKATMGKAVIQHEADIIRAATKHILAGGSLASMVGILNRAGERTSTGAMWDGTALRRVLLRPRNAGLMVHRGEVVEGVMGEWERIISPEEHRGLVAILGAPGRNKVKNGPEPRWLLSRILRCGICGNPMPIHGHGRTAPVYRCTDPVTRYGQHVGRTAPPLDDYITGLILVRLEQPDIVTLMAPNPVDIAPLVAEAEELRGQLSEVAALYAQKRVTGAQLAQITEDVQAQLAQVEARLASAAQVDPLAPFRAGQPVEEVWARLDMAQRRAVVRTLVDVVAHPARRGRPPGWRRAGGAPYLDTDSIEVTWRTAE